MTTKTAEQLETLREAIEERISALVVEEDVAYKQLYRASRYSLLNGGKRLRPLLALATAHAFGAETEKGLNAACALELIHTYSLIHDDLPCMDDDDLRRGKPALHRAFSEWCAVLTGDYLLTYAFEIIAADPLLADKQKNALVTALARGAGAKGMIGGQVLDLQSEGSAITYEELCRLHALKTGAMIAASLEIGGIIAGCSAESLETLKEFGHKCGLAFQMVDDIIDITTPEGTLGKTAGSDAANGKTTTASLLGVDQAKACAERLLAEASAQLKTLSADCSLLEELAKKMVYREY